MYLCFSLCPKLPTKHETLIHRDTYAHKQFLTAKTDYHIQIFSMIFVLYYRKSISKSKFSVKTYSFMKIYLLFCLNEILCTPEIKGASTQRKRYGILGILKFIPDVTSTPKCFVMIDFSCKF